MKKQSDCLYGPVCDWFTPEGILKEQYLYFHHWKLLFQNDNKGKVCIFKMITKGMTLWRKMFTDPLNWFFITCTFHSYSNSEYTIQRKRVKNIMTDLSLARKAVYTRFDEWISYMSWIQSVNRNWGWGGCHVIDRRQWPATSHYLKCVFLWINKSLRTVEIV